MTGPGATKVLLVSAILLNMLASGQTRYRYERPSRVVEIKQGRLQGTLVEVPIISSGQDKNQVTFVNQLLVPKKGLSIIDKWGLLGLQ
jgi:hypothetical protein